VPGPPSRPIGKGDRSECGAGPRAASENFATPDYQTEEPMPDLTGTKTEKNLLAAFAGESQARNRYTYFASQARRDGFEQIGRASCRERV